MTILNNYRFNAVTDEDIKRFFEDNNIDISNKQLEITRDIGGNIKKVDVDYPMSREQFDLFRSEFFDADHTVEEIGGITLSSSYYGDLTIELSKEKKYLRVLMYMLGLGDRISFKIFFNDNFSRLNYTVDESLNTSIFVNTTDYSFLYGIMDISKLNHGVRTGSIQYGENRSENAKIQHSFTWTNSADYITKIKLGIVGNMADGFAAGTKIIVYGWD